MLSLKYSSGRGVVHFEIIDASKPQFKRSFLPTSLLKARSASQEYPLIEWCKQFSVVYIMCFLLATVQGRTRKYGHARG